MLRDKTRRLISICLTAAIAACIVPVITHRQQALAADPYKEMVDERAEPTRTPRPAYSPPPGSYPEEAMRGADPFTRPAPTEDGKTDRYIVKYKNGMGDRFEGKVSHILESSLEIVPAMAAATGNLRVSGAPGGAAGHDEATAPSAESASRPPRDMRLLILREPMYPSELAAELRSLGADGEIEYIQPDHKLSLAGSGTPYGAVMASAPSVVESAEPPRRPSASAGGVLVAVIDSGADTGHELFAGRLHEHAARTETHSLSYAHGSHVTGILINTIAEAGADATILPIRVFDNGTAHTSEVIAAIAQATELGAQVVNMSFGGRMENRALREAMAGSGALFVCAAGNDRRDIDAEPTYPAGYDLPNVVSVGSVNDDGGYSYFSNYGPAGIDLAAPGRDVYSSLPGNEYGTMTGTSMSAAHVTGAAAAVLCNERMGAAELKDRLTATADILPHLENKVAGGRRLNIGNAITGTPGAPQQLDPADDFDAHGPGASGGGAWRSQPSPGMIEVSAGGDHSLALADDGTVWSWGGNAHGQLGDGTTADRDVPAQVIGLDGIVSVSAGHGYSVALRGDGTAWSWGLNDFGQLGDGTTLDRTIPSQVAGLTGITCISAGVDHTLAVKGDGTAWGFGHNEACKSGNGLYATSCTPEQAEGLDGIVSVSAGWVHSLALGDEGEVYAWGLGFTGLLGIGSYPFYTLPTECPGLSGHGIESISAGSRHSLAVDDGGWVWTWGESQLTPGQINTMYDIASASAGEGHSLALGLGGEVYGWGDNWSGQLGDGTTTARPDPAQVTLPSGATSVSAGYAHSLAADGSGAWAWGDNANGQLGDGGQSGACSDVPVAVSALSGGLAPPVATTLTFEHPGHAMTIPASGPITTTATATVYNQYGMAMPGVAVSYSLETAYAGVAMDAATGVVTVQPTAQPGTATLKAAGGGLTATAGLTLTAATAPAGAAATLTIEQGVEYVVPLGAADIASYPGMASAATVTVTYDPTKLELLDAAAQAPGTHTSAGAVPGTGLTITAISPGVLTLTLDAPIPAGSAWSGAITVLRFRALATGTATVGIG